jgi:3-hydroxyacyl-CoA dehydrogenase
VAAPGTIQASSTSGIPASQWSADLPNRSHCLVAHPINPPHVIPLVEICPAPWTAPEVVERVRRLHEAVGQVPIVLRKEVPGFVVNRLQGALLSEAFRLHAEGVASAEDIDAAVQGSMGFRLAAMGPLRVGDFAGLDILGAVFDNLAPDIASGTSAPPAIRALVEAGHLGFKAGEGVYRYSPESASSIVAERDRTFLELLKLLEA